jgi:hypothetical protein
MNEINSLILKKTIDAPQFCRVYSDELPIGCIAAYDYNRGEDIPLTFGFENFSCTPKIVRARDFFGQLPPHADKRVLSDLIEGDTVEAAIESIIEALLSLDKDFCKERELIFMYRSGMYPQVGILIRKPIVTKPKPIIVKEKKLSFFDKLFSRKNLISIT